MKKSILFTILIGISTYSIGQNWTVTGNTITPGAFLGTVNNEALIFKSNGNEGLRIKPNGEIRIQNFDDNTNKGLTFVNIDGVLSKLNFTGSSSDVLRGDGTFGSFSSLSGWALDGPTLFSNYNIGIGTNIAPEKLSVNGNIIASGSISGTSLNVIDIISSGKEFKISTALCLKGMDPTIAGSRNQICGLNGDLYIQSMNNNYNTIINNGNNGKVGIGIIPTEKFHVGVDAKFEGKLYANTIYTNRVTSEDSVIHIGDSSLTYYQYINRISWTNMLQPSNVGDPDVYVKGLAIGRGNGTFAFGNNSIAIGNNVKVDGSNSLVLGSGISSANTLNNSVTNSLMVGFNSNIPTLVVTSSSGTGTTGNVGIGTSTPDAKLTVHVQADPQIGAYGILSTSNIPTAKSISVIHKDPVNFIDQENFIVYTDGRVYCREVFVKLGQLGDFVFDEDYALMNYKELENYLKLNKHLPGVPAETEVLAGGLNVGEMQAKVLQKTEENTLYILDLNRRLEESESRNTDLEKRLKESELKQIEMEKKLNELINKK